MRRLLSLAGSLKLTVGLLLALCAALAVGTLVESTRGTEAARAVYYAPWFFFLQGIFALNVLCALVDRWPRNRYRVGFAVTHTALLVILAGALLTVAYEQEGQLGLWEGEQSGTVVYQAGGGEVGTFELPFELRLEAFEIDTYQGTMRPAMFRSRVTVVDPVVGVERPAIIEMNRELAYGGYRFFQSSYRQEAGREATILSVSRDPGQPVVFAGYVLLVAGMIVVYATRLVQRRQLAERLAARQLDGGRRRDASRAAAAACLALVATLAGIAPSEAATVPDAATVEEARRVPVQHDGRVMPYDTLAREAVWTVTGLRAWPGLDPVAMTLGWAFDPKGWADQPVVEVGGAEVASLVGLPEGTRYASFRTLTTSEALQALARTAREKSSREEALSPLEEDVQELESRLFWMQRFLGRDAFRLLPGQRPGDRWSIPELSSAADLAAVETRLRVNGAPPHYPTGEAVELELLYNARRPTRLAWLFLLPAALAAVLGTRVDNVWLRRLTLLGIGAGFATMTWGIAVRWQVAGRIPAANMYESLLFLGWGLGLFGVIALVLRNRLLVLNAAVATALTMGLVDLLPVDPFVHPVPPVLAGTPWLAIHVPIIMVGYAVLALGTVIAHLQIGSAIVAPARADLQQRFSELLYDYLHVGSILLLTGILTGSIWAASSWGRYWGWDPKEVWSLVAFLAYMAILHGRHDKQLGPFGVAAASIVAFQTILMTYLGVNYVLAAGLHSYGFGGSNVVRGMVAAATAEAAFLALGWWAHQRRRAPAPQLA